MISGCTRQNTSELSVIPYQFSFDDLNKVFTHKGKATRDDGLYIKCKQIRPPNILSIEEYQPVNKIKELLK